MLLVSCRGKSHWLSNGKFFLGTKNEAFASPIKRNLVIYLCRYHVNKMLQISGHISNFKTTFLGNYSAFGWTLTARKSSFCVVNEVEILLNKFASFAPRKPSFFLKYFSWSKVHISEFLKALIFRAILCTIAAARKCVLCCPCSNNAQLEINYSTSTRKIGLNHIYLPLLFNHVTHMFSFCFAFQRKETEGKRNIVRFLRRGRIWSQLLVF